MEFLLWVTALAILVVMGFVLAKLNRIEKQLEAKAEAKPEVRPPAAPVSSAETKREPRPAVRPPMPAAAPVRRPTFTPPVMPPETTVEERREEKPSAWSAFWSWFCVGSGGRENVSVEYAAATTWLIRAGIIVLLCGIGFFLKYSIERDLIRPEARIGMAFAAGLGMLIGGMRGIGKKFHLLAVGVLSAGIVTLYMGSYAGCKIYTVLPLPLGFVLMVLTTAAAMTVSAKLALFPVALTGCAGAYLTPILLSDGGGNLAFLCVYTVLVSAGVLIVSRLHRWRALEITAFVMSFLLLSVGSARLDEKIDLRCILSVFLNFLVFSLIPLIRKRESRLGLTEWLLPILAAAWGMALGIFMIRGYGPFAGVRGLASAGYAVLFSAVTLAEGLALERRRTDGARLQPAFLCASVFALALAIPLAFQTASASAAGWSILGAVLILAAAKSGRRTLVVLGLIVFALALLIVLPPDDVPGAKILPRTFWERFFRGGIFTAALFSAAFFLRKKRDTFMHDCGLCLWSAAGVSFLVYTSVELFRQLSIREATRHFRHGGLSVWWALLAILMVAGGIRKDLKAVRIAGLALFVVCLVKAYTVDIAGLDTLGRVVAFVLLGLLLLGGAAAYIQFRKRFSQVDK